MKARWLALCGCLWASQAQAQEYAASARVSTLESPGAEVLPAQEAREMAGALGESARALSNLPGVARAGFDSGELSIWGSPGQETRVYVDGVEIPALFHPGGLRSTVPPALIANVALTAGAFDASHGRALGGLVELETPALRQTGLHGSLRADGIDSGLELRAKQGAWGVSLAGRYGYLDRVVHGLMPELAERTSVPAHADAGGKVSWDVDRRTRLSLLWLGTRDRLQRSVASDVASVPDQQTLERSDQVGALSLVRRYADGARVRLLGFVGWGDRREFDRFDLVPFSARSAATRIGARASYARSWPTAQLQLGLDVLSLASRLERAGSLTLPAREGDLHVFGQGPGDEVNRDRWRTNSSNVAPYASVAVQRGPFSAQLGLRLELYALSVNRSTPKLGGVPAVGHDELAAYPEPRVAISLALHPALRLQARAGLHHQPPAASDLSAVFGTPSLGASRAMVGSMGPQAELPAGIVLRAEGFAKQLDRLARRSDDPTPRVSHALVQSGSGWSYGGALLLQRQVESGVGFLASYTLSRSTRTGTFGMERLFDLDQTHVLSALLSYRRESFLVSTRFRYATGNPRTSVLGSYYDSKSDSYQPSFAAQNRARVPAFAQLDLHAEQSFHVGETSRLMLYADLLNVTARANVEEVAYNDDFTRRRDVRGLPWLALLGIQMEL
ncbi:MAG: TonB-dependent receptor plug domain-containing protein [Myxococcales bacterium]